MQAAAGWTGHVPSARDRCSLNGMHQDNNGRPSFYVLQLREDRVLAEGMLASGETAGPHTGCLSASLQDHPRAETLPLLALKSCPCARSNFWCQVTLALQAHSSVADRGQEGATYTPCRAYSAKAEQSSCLPSKWGRPCLFTLRDHLCCRTTRGASEVKRPCLITLNGHLCCRTTRGASEVKRPCLITLNGHLCCRTTRGASEVKRPCLITLNGHLCCRTTRGGLELKRPCLITLKGHLCCRTTRGGLS